MPYASTRALALLTTLAITACRPRVTQEGFGRCGLVSIDSTPLGNVVSRSSPIVGELRVHAQLRADTRQPFIVTIVSSDSGGQSFTATSDTVATFHELLPGRYKVRVRSVGYSPRSFGLLVAPDSGREFVVPLHSDGGIVVCEDGVREVRRPWWRVR